MDKILVEIYLPVVDRSYDVYIPFHLKIYEVEKMVASAFAELSDGYFTSSADTVLCGKADGNPLDINKSALEQGLHNGSKLMLI